MPSLLKHKTYKVVAMTAPERDGLREILYMLLQRSYYTEVWNRRLHTIVIGLFRALKEGRRKRFTVNQIEVMKIARYLHKKGFPRTAPKRSVAVRFGICRSE
jgi:hypothetical protein